VRACLSLSCVTPCGSPSLRGCHSNSSAYYHFQVVPIFPSICLFFVYLLFSVFSLDIILRRNGSVVCTSAALSKNYFCFLWYLLFCLNRCLSLFFHSSIHFSSRRLQQDTSVPRCYLCCYPPLLFCFGFGVIVLQFVLCNLCTSSFDLFFAALFFSFFSVCEAHLRARLILL
jgi:hypothetical protein